jgi:probable HAF family extracellular repeat protein
MSLQQSTRSRDRVRKPGKFAFVVVTVFFSVPDGLVWAQTPIDLIPRNGPYGGVATGLNDNGQIVGFDGVNFFEHAFSWTATGGLIDLGTLGGVRSRATAVNASGQVVGDSDTANGVQHAFSWTPAGGMIDLGSLVSGGSSQAHAVNARGQVVGDSETADGSLHAFSWTPAGGMIDLGTLADFGNSRAVAVNASGDVVGWSALPIGVQRAFLWTVAGGMIDLGVLSGRADSNAAATAVNDSGQVVGSGTTFSGDSHAFSWTAKGGMIDLGTVRGPNSSAVAVNANGQVVGWSDTVDTEDEAIHAFSWTAEGGMIDLGTLGGRFDSYPLAVNASGQVVGESGRPPRAFTWTAQGGMVDLGTLGGAGSSAWAVNATGQIVGYAGGLDNRARPVLWPVVAQTLPSVADAYVRAGASASTNFGSLPTVRAKKGVSPDNTRRSYLKFDVAGVHTFERATLRLYGHLSNGSTREVQTTIYAVSDTSWDERAITWNTRPDLGAVLSRITVRGTTPQWYEVDVTTFVRAEQQAGRHVISLALRNVLHSSAYAEFGSRESGNVAPQLLIRP